MLEAFSAAKVQDLEDKILELGPGNIAAFIAEPILASGGVIVPPDGYQAACLEVCRRHDVLYISDEVVTGFGRLGHFFASGEVFGLDPDIIICAKGLTSGYQPLGAMLVHDRVLARLSETGAEGALFASGFTYSGHPITCAAALKNIEIIEREGLLEDARAVASHFQVLLRELTDLPIVTDVRGMGLMACVECGIPAKSVIWYRLTPRLAAVSMRTSWDPVFAARPAGFPLSRERAGGQSAIQTQCHLTLEDYMAFAKTLTSKPVVTVDRFTSPDTMVSQVRRGVIEQVGAARPLIAGPFLPSKISEGRTEDIPQCIGCNICSSGDGEGVPIRCTQNPTIGEEWRRGWHPERIARKGSDDRVLIVGAGPAGLEVASATASASTAWASNVRGPVRCTSDFSSMAGQCSP